jgi:hypothetical protein
MVKTWEQTTQHSDQPLQKFEGIILSLICLDEKSPG